jgi:hypothetical protein
MNGINTSVIISLALGGLLLFPISLGLTTLSLPTIPTGGAIANAQYSYVITISGSNYQVLNGITRAVLYQSTSSSQTVSYLLGSSGVASSGDSVYVESGAYTVDASWFIRRNDIQVFFSPQAVLTPRSFANENSPYTGTWGGGQPVLWIYGNGVVISGVTIDGNWLNQYPSPSTYITGPNFNGGINVAGNDCVIEYSTICNIRCYGIWTTWNFNVKNLLVKNCLIYNVSANGVSLGVGQYTSTTGYIINCEFHHCGDCAIDLSGDNGIVTGNYIHDIGSIVPHGYVDSGWAVCIEFGHGTGNGTYEFVADNTITNTIVGVAIQGVGTFHDILVSGNTVDTASQTGIQIGLFGAATNNIIEYNTLRNCVQHSIYIQTLASNTNVYGNTYNNCGSYYNAGSGTTTTQPSVVAVKVTSNPTREGLVTANGSYGYGGANSTSPYTFYVTVGSSVALVANDVSGFTFSNWSDGGTQSHTIIVQSSYQTYTANYS